MSPIYIVTCFTIFIKYAFLWQNVSARRASSRQSLDIQCLPVFDKICPRYPSAIASVDICRKQKRASKSHWLSGKRRSRLKDKNIPPEEHLLSFPPASSTAYKKGFNSLVTPETPVTSCTSCRNASHDKEGENFNRQDLCAHSSGACRAYHRMLGGAGGSRS